MHRSIAGFLALVLAAGCAGTPPPPPQARDDSLRPRGDGTALLAPKGRIADDRIAESSGLAYAGGWWWTHNDSGDGPFLFRSRSPYFEGAERVEVPGAKAVDWEELAVLGGDLLVCDVGDNGRRRNDIVIYRVRPTDAGVQTVATYPVTYPDGRHDAEGVWVWDGRVHVVLKNRGEDAHWVYRFDELVDGKTNTPTRVGAVEIPSGEQVTAADAHVDGHVAMLTYSQLLVWPATAVKGPPRQTFTLHARQCEALAWTRTGVVFTNEQRDVYVVDDLLACDMRTWLPLEDRARLSPVGFGSDSKPYLDMLPFLRAHDLREGESIRMGRARDRILVLATLRPDTDLVPTTERLGSSLLLAFGTRKRLRVTPDDAVIGVVLWPQEKVGAVAMDLGAGKSDVDADSISVEVVHGDGVVKALVEIPIETVFPDGLPQEFRMAAAGNGLRKGDDEPTFGALDVFSLLRPYVWALVEVD